MTKNTILLGLATCCITLPGLAGTLALTPEEAQALSERVGNEVYGGATSVWIESNGEVLVEAYFRGADADAHHNMRSVGKTVTGMLFGAAVADGHVDGAEVLAADWFEELQPFQNPDPRKDGISVRDLLTMSSGLECDDWNSFSRGNEERMYLVEDWSAFFWKLPIKNRPSWEIPEDDGGFDRLFAYCTAGVQLVGELVERATGKTAEQYAASRLFGPLGVGDPKWNYGSNGKAHLGGGLELTTAGWAAVARLYLNDGKASGEQVIPTSWVEESLTDYVKIDDNTNYGYLWWRPRYEVNGTTYTANMMTGTGGNRIYMLPEFGVVVVLTKNAFRDREAHPKSDKFFLEEVVSRLVE